MSTPTLESDVAYIRTRLAAWHAELDLPHPGVPVEMRTDPTCNEEWQSWRLIDSTYSWKDVNAFERRLPTPLPQFFKAYMLAFHTLGMDFGEYNLPESPSDRSLARNFVMLLDDTFWATGYMQFGHARGCGDPLLLDFQSVVKEGDYGVVVFNHDVVPHEIIKDREKLKPYESRLAPSFRTFFDLVLDGDESVFPAPPSPEEKRRNIAWAEVAELLEKKGLPKYFRPKEVPSTDPWAIANFLRHS
jgi:hypothetical protein